jgi:hypothetical protein
LRLADGSLLKLAGDGHKPGETAVVVLRAERILLTEKASDGDDLSVLDGIVRAVDYQGVAARYFVEAAGSDAAGDQPDRRPPVPGRRQGQAAGARPRLRAAAGHGAIIARGPGNARMAATYQGCDIRADAV